YRRSDAPHGHPGRSADVWRVDGGEARLGWIGELHPRLLRALDLDGPVLGFELDLAPLCRRAIPRPQALSRYPSVRRDIAFVAPDTVPWSALEATIRRAGGPLLSEVRLFDRYLGKGVDPGFRSLATGLILLDKSRTLTDGDVDRAVAAIMAALQDEHGARVRTWVAVGESVALTNAEMAEKLYEEVGLNKREAKEFVDAFFTALREALEGGRKVKRSGFGNFALRRKTDGPGR